MIRTVIVDDQPLARAGLRAMLDQHEGELNKLVLTMQAANTTVTENAEVMNLDFSHRRSSTNPGSSDS